MVHYIVIILFFFFLKPHPWFTEVKEDASDQPFSFQKYFFSHYKDNIHMIMLLTQGRKVRFIESKALEETFETLLL